MEKLKKLLEYLGISDCKMQEGSLRCDANISVKPVESVEFGVKTEIKNMNSMKALEKALEYEEIRHKRIFSNSEEVAPETRRWDDDRSVTVSMRAKDKTYDYRSFPESDLVPIVLTEDMILEIKRNLPELPDLKKKRFIEEYGIPEYDASVLTLSRDISLFFEECAKGHKNPKAISNWAMGEVMRVLKEREIEIGDIGFSPQHLRELVNLIDDGHLSSSGAKQVFEEMLNSGKEPKALLKELGLQQISDEDAMEELVNSILAQNQKSVEDYRNGKSNALAYLVGQAMKASKGKANPQIISRMLKDKL